MFIKSFENNDFLKLSLSNKYVFISYRRIRLFILDRRIHTHTHWESLITDINLVSYMESGYV